MAFSLLSGNFPRIARGGSRLRAASTRFESATGPVLRGATHIPGRRYPSAEPEAPGQSSRSSTLSRHAPGGETYSQWKRRTRKKKEHPDEETLAMEIPGRAPRYSRSLAKQAIRDKKRRGAHMGARNATEIPILIKNGRFL